jgi:hypothetical protein
MTEIVERPALRSEKRGVDVRTNKSLFASFSSEKEESSASLYDRCYGGGKNWPSLVSITRPEAAVA